MRRRSAHALTFNGSEIACELDHIVTIVHQFDIQFPASR